MPISIYIFLILQLLIVSYYDLREKKIYKWWPLLNLGLYFTLCFLLPTYYVFSLEGLLYPILIFVFGFLFFLMKKAGVHIAGGGDAKYLSTVFLLTPHGLHSTFLLQILYSTILVGLLMIVNNTIKNFHEIVSLIRGNNWRLVGQFYGKKFSYAPVILLAWMGIGWLYKNTMY